jgi:hypothetical protein
MLQKVAPKPLIEPGTVKTDADWSRAGKRLFEGYDFPVFRTYDPKVIAAARSGETLASRSRPVKPRRDGTLRNMRWFRAPAAWRSVS